MQKPSIDAIVIMMRTTLNIEDEVFYSAKSLAGQGHISIGDAFMELACRGLQQPRVGQSKNGFPCFYQSAGAEPITLECTLELEDE